MADPKYLSGDSLKLTAPGAGFVAGVPIILNKYFVLPANDAVSGATSVCDLSGVWVELAKKTADVFADGDLVYWDDSLKEMTLTSGGMRFVGHAFGAYDGTVSIMSVRIDPRAHLAA